MKRLLMATAVAALAIVVTASDASAQRWGRGFGVGFRGPGISRIGWGGGVSRVWGGRPGIGWGVRRVGWGGWGVRRVGWAGKTALFMIRACTRLSRQPWRIRSSASQSRNSG